MLKELNPEDLSRAGHLFQGFDYSLSIQAAILGWYYYKRGEYARTVAYYDRVFAQRPESPDYYYHLTALAWAALGDEDKALHFLGETVDRGWDAVQWTREQEPFRILHGRPEWSALLERMAEAAGG